LLEFPVVECLVSFLVAESKEVHEVLQALNFLVNAVVRWKRLRNRVDALIPAIADMAEVLERLANHENCISAKPARHLLRFRGANMLL
jgi:hypothetical protein